MPFVLILRAVLYIKEGFFELRNEKGKKEMTIQASDLKGLSGENILAGKTRVFTFAKTGKFKNITPSSKVIIDFGSLASVTYNSIGTI